MSTSKITNDGIQNRSSAIDIISGKISGGTSDELTLYKSGNVKTFKSSGVKFSSSASSWTDLMTLPSDCRPQSGTYGIMYNGTAGPAVVYIGASGNVQIAGATADVAYLFCISYI